MMSLKLEAACSISSFRKQVHNYDHVIPKAAIKHVINFFVVYILSECLSGSQRSSDQFIIRTNFNCKTDILLTSHETDNLFPSTCQSLDTPLYPKGIRQLPRQTQMVLRRQMISTMNYRSRLHRVRYVYWHHHGVLTLISGI